MLYEFKKIRTNQEARDALKKGIDLVANIVGGTLGPAGQNVVIEAKGLGWGRTRAPVITNDGVSIARQIVLEDEIEDMGAQSLIDVAVKTNEMVGDGTTTSVVLAHAIIDKIFKKLDEEKLLLKGGINIRDFYNQVNESCAKVVEKLKAMAKPIKEKKDIENVAMISLANEELGKMVAGMVHKIGKDGLITVEEGYGYETKTELVSGMKKVGSYLNEQLMTNSRKEAVLKDPIILVMSGRIEDQTKLKGVCDWLLKNQKKELVVICEGYSKEIAPFVVFNKIKAVFYCLAIKAPALTISELEDVAIYTGAKFIDQNQGMNLEHLEMTDLGRAEKIVVDKDDIFIVKGKGDKKAIDERIEKLKVERDEVEKTDMFKKKIDKRIASLSGGVGLIEVAAKSDAETEYLLRKVEDSVLACKAAMEEGIVKGGGLALKEINDELPKDDILKDILDKPYEKIQENAGGQLEIGDNVIDPVKVVRVALENACSMAGIFITVQCAIAWKKNKLTDELGKLLQEREREKNA